MDVLLLILLLLFLFGALTVHKVLWLVVIVLVFAIVSGRRTL